MSPPCSSPLTQEPVVSVEKTEQNERRKARGEASLCQTFWGRRWHNSHLLIPQSLASPSVRGRSRGGGEGVSQVAPPPDPATSLRAPPRVESVVFAFRGEQIPLYVKFWC